MTFILGNGEMGLQIMSLLTPPPFTTVLQEKHVVAIDRFTLPFLNSLKTRLVSVFLRYRF